MYSFPDLQNQAGWTRQAGPGIGPNEPASYGYFQPAPGGGMLLYVLGQKGHYSGWLTALHLPLPSGLPKAFMASLDIEVIFDKTVPVNAQAFEFDLIHCQGGMNYLCGTQVLPTQANALQISNNGGGWQEPFPGPSALPVNQVNRFTFTAAINTEAKTYQRGPVVVNNSIFMPPAPQGALDAKQMDWSDGLIIQIQQGTTDQGTGWTAEILSVTLTLL